MTNHPGNDDPAASIGGSVDLLVVGAGVVGLAHAVEAHLRGLSVAVVERDDRAVGASVRNFGHLCATPQAGAALDYAMAARERWTALGAVAGFEVQECGTLVLARTADELGVLEEFASRRGPDQVVLLDATEVGRRIPRHDPAVLGGAHLPLDLRTDPRTAVAAIATWLNQQGVRIHWRTSATSFAPGRVETSRGPISARRVVVAVGHDVDRLFPELADEVDLQRCRLQMLLVSAPDGLRVDPAVLSGLSMLRYDGLSATTAADDVRATIASEAPELLDSGVNLMFTQRADGDLVIGDTHHYAVTHDPFDEEATADLVLRETARLLDVDRLTVRQRWRGVYASSTRTNFLIDKPLDDVAVVSVTSGIGMTTSHGLAAAVLDDLL